MTGIIVLSAVLVVLLVVCAAVTLVLLRGGKMRGRLRAAGVEMIALVLFGYLAFQVR